MSESQAQNAFKKDEQDSVSQHSQLSQEDDNKQATRYFLKLFSNTSHKYLVKK